MKIIITKMEVGKEVKQVFDTEDIVHIVVDGFELTDEAGGLRIRSRDALRITPAAANSIHVQSIRK